MKKPSSFGIILISIISIVGLVGCSTSPSTILKKEKVKDIQIEKNAEQQLKADLDINYGNVYITGGAKDLVNGDITYNINKLKPKVKYKSKKHKGKLSINQPKKGGIDITKGSLKNDWDLQLTNDVPLDRKSTRLNSSHVAISYAVFCLKKKKKKNNYN